jgi:glycosyltransferase involved in cell wall biosynthesis
MRTLSIVIPCHNEAQGIDRLFEGLGRLAAALSTCRLEIVCVNDGSTDETLAKLLGQQESFGAGEVVVVDLSRNFGKEAALSAGLATARGDAVVMVDADLQHPLELVPRMVELWDQGNEVVLGRRTDRSSDPWLRRVGTRIFYSMHNAMSEVAIPPDVGDFRLMDRVAVDAVNALPENRRFMKGLFAWAGFRTATLDYECAPRGAGGSRFGAGSLAHLAVEAITSFSLAPLRIASLVGLAVASASMVYGCWIVLRTLVFGVDVPGYSSIFTAILFLGGLQLMALGIIGEYLGRTYMESKRRPAYVVRAVRRRNR